MKITRDSFKITEAFGTQAQIERLMDEAITMAMATGSVGASVSEAGLDENFKIAETAKVTVSRIAEVA